jgi:hypothetical protein
MRERLALGATSGALGAEGVPMDWRSFAIGSGTATVLRFVGLWMFGAESSVGPSDAVS